MMVLAWLMGVCFAQDEMASVFVGVVSNPEKDVTVFEEKSWVEGYIPLDEDWRNTLVIGGWAEWYHYQFSNDEVLDLGVVGASIGTYLEREQWNVYAIADVGAVGEPANIDGRHLQLTFRAKAFHRLGKGSVVLGVITGQAIDGFYVIPVAGYDLPISETTTLHISIPEDMSLWHRRDKWSVGLLSQLLGWSFAVEDPDTYVADYGALPLHLRAGLEGRVHPRPGLHVGLFGGVDLGRALVHNTSDWVPIAGSPYQLGELGPSPVVGAEFTFLQ